MTNTLMIQSVFYDVLYNAIELFISKKQFTTSSFPYFNFELKKLYSKKIIHKRFKNYQKGNNYVDFISLCDNCYRNYITIIENNLIILIHFVMSPTILYVLRNCI